MPDTQEPQGSGHQSLDKARKIIDGLSKHRIDPRRIKPTETELGTKGGQSTVILGTKILPEQVATSLAKDRLKCLLESKLAIKKLKWNREDAEASAKSFKSFVNEVSIMAQLSHRNIVRLFGFVENKEKGDAWIILTWEENGNIREFLQSGEWDIPERISLVQDVINGVEYLHTRQPPICHGDLKSLNILVNSSYHAMITDFGSARIKRNRDLTKGDSVSKSPAERDNCDVLQDLPSPKIHFNPSTMELTLTGPGFSLRWTAPEVLINGEQDLPSDMWAIGWICWEIFTGRIPFDGLNAQGVIISHVIKGRLAAIREEAQLSCIVELCSLMSDCWISRPIERIDASMFRRKVHLLPSTTPSRSPSGDAKVRSAALLHELGTMYYNQSNTAMAEFHFQSAIDVATRTKDDRMKGKALDSLGVVYLSQSRYQEAEKAFTEAHEIHSRVGDNLGVGTTLRSLGDTYLRQSRYQEAEKAFTEAHEIHSRLGSDRDAGHALGSLGEIYLAQSRNQEAEKAFTEAHEIHSRVGDDLGVGIALDGLGKIYLAQSRNQEAEKALTEAREIYSRIGDDHSATNALLRLGTIYVDQSKNREAEKAFTEAHEVYSRIGYDLGAAAALLCLGTAIYQGQPKSREAEKAFTEAHEIYSRIGSDQYAGYALFGLGEVYQAQSMNQEAEKTFAEAHKISSRVGDDRGAANALQSLGLVYRAQSRPGEAEKAFKDAHSIYSRIANHKGTAETMHDLAHLYSDQSRFAETEASSRLAVASYDHAEDSQGKARMLFCLARGYRTQRRYLEAEEAVNEALAIWISIDAEAGQADALLLLSRILTAQCRYDEAKEVLIQAEAISTRIGDGARRVEVLDELGHLHLAQGTYDEAEECYRLAQAISFSMGDARGKATELLSLGKLYVRQGQHDGKCEAKALDGLMELYIDEEQPREIPQAEPRSLYEIGATRATSSFDDGTTALVSHQNPDQSSGSDSGSLLIPFTPVYKATEASLPEPSSPPQCPQTSVTSHQSTRLLHLSSRRTYEASTSSRLASAADPASNDDQQERFFIEQLAGIKYVPASATNELVDLLQNLGRAAPQAIRNKHKIYSILRVAHDTCHGIIETGNPSAGQKYADVKQLLGRMEQYCVALDALEEILLEFAEALPFEITPFGPEGYSSWLHSRSIFAGILNKLCHLPFPAVSYKTQNIAEDSFFDDCSWLSRLLYSGIDAEVAVQFTDPPLAHPVLAVTDGLHYLVSQIKYGTQNEQTRELVLDIATLLARTLAATSPNHDGELRQRTPSPPTAAGRDWLIQALADSFSILDLDTTLEASTAQKLASKWTEIKMSLTSTAAPPWSPIETPDSANFVMEITSSTLSGLTRMGTIPYSSVPATPATLEPSVWDDASIAEETERGARSIISDDRSASPSKMSS